MLALMVVGLLGILGRLVQLQVRDATEYEQMALTQRTRDIDLPPTRGSIFDRDGEQLALSVPAKGVFADPALIHGADRTARIVAKSLGLDEGLVLDRITGGGRFVYLKRGVAPEVAAELKRRNLPGIGFLDESIRRYPAGPLAPQVLGFVGTDGEGLAGLEYKYQGALAGRAGHASVEANRQGVPIPQGRNLGVPPVPGDDLVLTIDSDVQYRAQRALAQAVRENKAKGGTVIVMNPKTGEILAMTSYPWFDPNDFGAASDAETRNRAVTDVYEPGSVNKIITAAAALEEGVIDPDERLMIPDHLQIYAKVFHDAHPHPTEEMTLGDILAYSSNIGAITVAQELGKDELSRYLARFGLGSKTGLGFPGESGGIVLPPEEWSGTHIGTVPIGQGLAVTPLQMASVYATVANGGVRVQPKLVAVTILPDGTRVPTPPAVERRVISARTSMWLTRMLGLAVEAGTGSRAEIPNYWVAGKTGTARKPKEDGTGYYDNRFVASFIGFVPAARPSLVVAAVIDEPELVYGGLVSAPLFQEVARFALGTLHVPPAPPVPLPPHAIPIPGS